MPKDNLYAFHRFSIGTGWRQQNRCYHPEHKFQRGKKAPKVRTIPLQTLAVFNTNNNPLPVGAAFCHDHLKAINKSSNEEPELGKKKSGIEQTPTKYIDPVDDDIFIPEQAIISNDILEDSINTEIHYSLYSLDNQMS